MASMSSGATNFSRYGRTGHWSGASALYSSATTFCFLAPFATACAV